jgi:hypothetical protein
MNKKHTMEELKDIAPILNKLPKKNNFNTPEDYFDELPAIIQGRIKTKSTFQWGLTFKYALPVLVIIMMVFYFNDTPSTTTSPIQISKQEAIDYLNKRVDYEIDEMMLTDELADNLTTKQTESSSMDEYLLNDIDEDLLIDEI